MPTYFYKCENCDKVREDDASINSFREHHPVCDKKKCEGICNYTFIPTLNHIVLRDGPSGSWPSKGERIKKQRAAASNAAGKRQRDRYGESKKRDMIPNYGVDTGTWEEARNLALKERGPESAATYDKLVAKEKSKKIT